MTKALPVINILLAVGAAGVYAVVADWRHALYWAAAAVLTATVTF